MIENIKALRSGLSEGEMIDVMEKIADFGDMISIEFPIAFPDMSGDEYQHTEMWHLLIGSTLPTDYRITDSLEVSEWMEKKMGEFLDSI